MPRELGRRSLLPHGAPRPSEPLPEEPPGGRRRVGAAPGPSSRWAPSGGRLRERSGPALCPDAGAELGQPRRGAAGLGAGLVLPNLLWLGLRQVILELSSNPDSLIPWSPAADIRGFTHRAARLRGCRCWVALGLGVSP